MSTRSTTFPAPVASLAPGLRRPAPRVVLSYGLGVDSTAILLRWLLEPDSRAPWFTDLDDLVVLTAMTGDEWDSTGIDIETHLLPLLRAHGVRFVQVARSARNTSVDGTGVAVLDDSTNPERLHLKGLYRLSDEMLSAGTIPQTGGARLCSVHAKGDALDPAIEALTAGAAFTHVVGFEAGEPKRAAKDERYNTATRTGAYPLIEWGWDRAACEAYILDALGVAWDKSACAYCPFALSNKTGRARVLSRYADDATAGVDTLFMEHIALALNPTQGLVGGTRAIDIVRAAAAEQPGLSGLAEVLTGLDARLEATEHALYQVRRIIRPRKDDPTKMANAARSVVRLATGSRAEMADLLATAAEGSIDVGADGITRAYLHTRGEILPATEEFLVVAPSVVADKQAANFEGWWAEARAAGH